MPKVLLAEDDEVSRFAIRRMLEHLGNTVITAQNGEEALSLLEQNYFDVILMDVVMPEMNGFQATRKLTRDPKTSHIPVVIISTKNQETDRIWGKRQGARDYLSKPITEEALITVIRSVME